jgi:hypothetical protein
MSLVTREGKGSKLTIAEMDGNLTYLESIGRPYKVYTALLTQTGTNAPVATVLENTLGEEVVWTYEGDGGYATDDLTFDETKTAVFITPSTDFTDTPVFAIGYSVGRIIIYTVNNGVYSDEMLKNTPIEIRVYP